jgi:hypothetical protein
MTDNDKISFILKNELLITKEVLSGFKPFIGDKFESLRQEIKKYRIDLGIIKNG